jgi:hypothetical protein
VLPGIALPRFAIHFDKRPLAGFGYWLATAWLFLASVALWQSQRILDHRAQPSDPS